MTTRIQPSEPAVHARRAPSLAAPLAALSLPMLMSSLDTSIVNAVLPTLAGALGAPFAHVQWVVLAYLLAVTTLIVGAGALGDRLGRRRMLLAGIVLFTAASAACGLAPSLGALVAARALQGAGAAAMMALSLASIGDAAPHDRSGRAIGLLATMSAIGTALGPSLGGVLAAASGWRVVFLVNVPAGIASFALAWFALPRDRRPADSNGRRFDVAGMVVLALTLPACALAMTLDHPGAGPWRIALLLAAALGAGLFAVVESRAPGPIVSLPMLGDRRLASSLAAGVLVAAVMMSTLVVGPFYLVGGLGLDGARAGLVLSAGPLVVALSSLLAGRAVDRFGASRVAGAGLAAIGAGALLLCGLPTSLGVRGYVCAIATLAAGYALFQTANNTLVIAGMAPERRGVASGLLSLARNLGLITGASALGALFALATGTDQLPAASPEAIARGMRTTFAVAAALMAGAFALTRATPAADSGPASDASQVPPTPVVERSPK